MKNNPVAKHFHQFNKPSVVPHKHKEKLENELDKELEQWEASGSYKPHSDIEEELK